MFNKAVLISIHPKWCEKIASGEKTIEVRKTRPKIDTPFKCFIYCTESNTKNPWKLLEIHSSDGKIHKGNGKVIGEFICDYWYQFFYNETEYSTILTKLGCLSIDEVWEYGKGKTLYGWHISDLKIYDEPKELGEFYKPCPNDAPCKLCKCVLVYEDNLITCGNKITRPPQSWCYVEAENG